MDKKNRVNDLAKTLSVQTTSYKTKKMRRFLRNEVAKIPGCVIHEEKENIYVTKGEAETYPCIVAHTDTVHDLVKNFKIFRSDDVLFSIDGNTLERVGIGGDDKVGIFVALEVLRNVDVCKAAFFRDEEVGCKGSGDADMAWFDNVEFALQCDRKGSNDFVDTISGTTMYDKSFSNAISTILDKYGRQEVDGGLTDVCQLVDNGLKVCAANMSCGYYDPHTDNEYVVISEVMNTLDMVLEMFEALAGQVWEVKEDERNIYNSQGGFGNKHGWNWGGWGASARDFSTSSKDDEVLEHLEGACCTECGTENVGHDEFEDSYYCFNCDIYLHPLCVEVVDIIDLEEEGEIFDDRSDLDRMEIGRAHV